MSHKPLLITQELTENLSRQSRIYGGNSGQGSGGANGGGGSGGGCRG